MPLEIEIYMDAHPAIAKLEGIEQRILDHEPAFDEVMSVLERSEERLFDAWNGRYVDTGATKASLTQPDADGAIREAHAQSAEFGTSIPYTVYLREHGRSAVMRFDEADQAEVSAVVLRYIMEGLDGQ
jgi:hypothetical protein